MSAPMTLKQLRHWRDRHQHRSLLQLTQFEEAFDLACDMRVFIDACARLSTGGHFKVEAGDADTVLVHVWREGKSERAWVAEGMTLRAAIVEAARQLMSEEDSLAAFLKGK